MSYMNIKTNKNHGFTIIEMMIIAPIVILVIGTFITAIVNMTGDTLATRASNSLSYSIQDALNRIGQDVKSSGSFLATNNITVISPQGYNDNTTNFHNADATNGTMLILNSYATDKNPLDMTQKKVYASGQPIMINIIYFVKNGTLWRRVLTPTNYTSSDNSVPWQQSSCAPGVSGTQCKTQDTRLVDGVSADNGFNVSYYPNTTSSNKNIIASDSASTDAARLAAMTVSSTVNVTINATSTAAGRNISQSGSIKAISPNDNSLTTPARLAPTMLSQPSNRTDLASDTNITFTATAQGAAPITVKWQYSPDQGTTWTDIVGATATTLTIPSITNTMDGYRYKAIFTNSQGSVTSSSALLTVNLLSWSTFALQNSWVDFGGTYNTNGYRKTTDGLVVLKGLVKKTGTPVVQEVIGTLPVSYRPSGILIFQSSSIDAPCRIDVYPNGEVRYISGSSSWISLEGIHFMPNNGRYTRTPIASFMNGWTNFSSGYEVTSYVIDNSNRVNIQGLLRPGTSWAEATRIFDMPTNLLPAQYMHVATASEVMSAIGIEYRAGSTGIVAKGIGSGWLSANVMYYPSSYNSWTNLTLQNSWTAYGSIYTTPQYTKSPDGLVTLQGFLRYGTVASGTVIAQLPTGYRPGATVLATTISNLLYARIDIDSSGNIISRTTDTNWLSFDGISFYADQ